MNLYDETLQAAVRLYGEAEENLPLLCSAAVDSYTARLREGVTAEDCAEVLSTAAALVAVATLRCGGTTVSYTHLTLRRYNIRLFRRCRLRSLH